MTTVGVFAFVASLLLCFAALPSSAWAEQVDPIEAYGTAHPGIEAQAASAGRSAKASDNAASTFSSPLLPGWKSSYGSSKFGYGTKTYTVRGVKAIAIDVSVHQGANIDWSKVKLSGIDYAIIRCGYGDDFASQDDKRWISNVKAAKKAGLHLGTYLYSYAKRATGSESAASEAKHTLRLLKQAGLSPKDLALPVYYDLEESYMTKYSAKKLGDIATTYCNAISDAGYKVGIYSGYYWWRDSLTDSRITSKVNSGAWSRWVPQYNICCYMGEVEKNVKSTRVVNAKGNYDDAMDAWQFTSAGTVSGIRGNVDMNFFFKSYTSLNRSSLSGATTLTYTGKARVPSLTVTLDGIKLVKGEDFVVSAPSSVNVGTYKCSVKGIGNYTGSKSFTYTVKPAKVNFKKLKAASKAVKVYWTPNKAQASGYYVKYSTSKSFKSYKQVKVKGKSSSYVKLEKLTKNKKYYVKVRAYKVVNGVTYYSSWSDVKTMRAA